MALANLAQQFVSGLIFLFIPRMLSVDAFAQVTFVTSLLSFLTFADLGFSFVYGRKMPVVYASHDEQEIKRWNYTTYQLRAYSALLYALGATAVYIFKYHEFSNALLFLLLPPAMVLFQLHVTYSTVRQKFHLTRDLNVAQAIARLLILPAVYLFGLSGWFTGQLVSAMVVFGLRDFRRACVEAFFAFRRFDWGLVRQYLPEAMMLGLITTCWTQLLGFSRIYASFAYHDVVIAQYGLAIAGYQVVSGLMIAMFVPQTIKTYRRLESNQTKAFEFVAGVVLKTTPVMCGVTVLGNAIAPWFLRQVFHKYHVPENVLFPILSGLVVYPVLCTVGTLYIGTGKRWHYLWMTVAALALAWVSAGALYPFFGVASAAVAQFTTLGVYSMALILGAVYTFRQQLQRQTILKFILTCALLALFVFSVLLLESRHAIF